MIIITEQSIKKQYIVESLQIKIGDGLVIEYSCID